MSDPRNQAFLEPRAEFAGLKLRPFSAGTLTLCRELKLTMVTGTKPVDGEPAPPITEEQKQQQLVILLFIQSAPVETVKRAVKLARTDWQGFLDDYLLPFEIDLPVTAIGQIAKELETVFSAVTAAEFDVKDQGSGARDPNA